jgi:hypothetical protein
MNFKEMKDAVTSIEMSKTMKNRIIENCNMVEKDKAIQLNVKRWISAACAMGILLSVIIGIPYMNKNGELQVADFAITAYALSEEGNNLSLSSAKASFDLSTKERIGLVNRIGGDGANLIFSDVVLNVTGEEIDSITYTINKGLFIEDVTLTAEAKEDRNWLLSEKIHVIYGEPGSELYHGIKEIGNTYTVTYNEQDQYKYTLAIPHDGHNVVDEDIFVRVNVKYTDGNSEQQDIVVTQESEFISLKLK